MLSGEESFDLFCGSEAVPQGSEIARTASVEGQARKGARQIGCALQRRPQPVPQFRFRYQEANGIEPRIDLTGIGQGRHQPLRQEPAT